jgi:hypothetical protein
MYLKPEQHRYASLAAVGSSLPSPRHLVDSGHPWECALSRRHFLRTAAGATGLALGSSLVSPALANGSADPRPIPGGFDLPPLFHILAPGYPGLDLDPATNDPSTITDFIGDVGLTYVRGTGVHTDLATGRVRALPFEVDMRFMQGVYVGEDGRRHNGTFGLI